jgi:hypothetical protein
MTLDVPDGVPAELHAVIVTAVPSRANIPTTTTSVRTTESSSIRSVVTKTLLASLVHTSAVPESGPDAAALGAWNRE